jgi:cellulose synthase/poly-beta-1,6-N-acetylglucosamine synthase-like glycosyltransferase
MNLLTVTVGIPTYYGAPALIRTAESILNGTRRPERLVVSVDGNPLKPEIRTALESLGVEVIFNAARGGQVARIKQILTLAETDLVVTTQDDVLFAPEALANLVNEFTDDPDLTMTGANVQPVPARTTFEKTVEVGVRLTRRLGEHWRDGDNYLLASGRCLAFRTAFAQAFEIPEEVVNSDAYLYFENRRRGGTFRGASEAVVYNRSPQTMAEHEKQSKRFQRSLAELNRYFPDHDLSADYTVPLSVKTRAALGELFAHPIDTVRYFAVFGYTRLRQLLNPSREKRFWQTDLSTKRV